MLKLPPRGAPIQQPNSPPNPPIQMPPSPPPPLQADSGVLGAVLSTMLGGPMPEDTMRQIIGLQAAMQPPPQVGYASGTVLTEPPQMFQRGDDREITFRSTSDYARVEPGLREWIRDNCQLMQVPGPDPSHDPRIQAIINASSWRNDIKRQQQKIRPNALVKVLPLEIFGFYVMRDTYVPDNDDFVPIRLNLGSGYGGGTEEQLRLDDKARQVDIKRIGLISLAKPKYISPQLLATYVRYGVAQGLFDNIYNTESGAHVRDFLVGNDFLDGNGDRIHGYEWIQPPHIGPMGTLAGYPTSGDAFDLYTTNRNCNNDRKIYFVYGLKNLKYSGIPRQKGEVGGVVASVGGPAEIFLSRLDIRRGDVVNIDVADTSLINDMGALFFQRPALFRRSDDMKIRGWLKHNAMGRTDNLRPLGFVVEARGSMVTG